MKLPIKPKYIGLFIVISTACLGLARFYEKNIIELYAEIQMNDLETEINSWEKDFSDEKNLPTCIHLTERLSYMGESALALHYGHECELLGVQETPLNYAFNIWMAKAEKNNGDDARAMSYLEKAFTQDISHRITEQMIISSDLTDIALRIRTKNHGAQ